MKRVYLESPYAPPASMAPMSEPWLERRNEHVRYAHAAIRDSLRRGEAPIASHVLYTTALNDRKPDEREKGIQAGFSWALHAQAWVVYVDFGVSRGMWEGLKLCRQLGRVAHFRQLLAEHHLTIIANGGDFMPHRLAFDTTGADPGLDEIRLAPPPSGYETLELVLQRFGWILPKRTWSE